MPHEENLQNAQNFSERKYFLFEQENLTMLTVTKMLISIKEFEVSSTSLCFFPHWNMIRHRHPFLFQVGAFAIDEGQQKDGEPEETQLGAIGKANQP